MAPDSLTRDVTSEVESLYRFFAGWYTGGIAHDESLVQRHVRSRLAPDFLFIDSTGTVMDGDRLTTEVGAAYGSVPGLAIAIRDLRVRRVLAAAVVITYQEWQTEGDEATGVLTTAMLLHADPWQWLHIQETALSGPPPGGL